MTKAKKVKVYTILISPEFERKLNKLAREFLAQFLDISQEMLKSKNIKHTWIAQTFRAELLHWIIGRLQQHYAECCWKAYNKLSEDSPFFSNLQVLLFRSLLHY